MHINQSMFTIFIPNLKKAIFITNYVILRGYDSIAIFILCSFSTFTSYGLFNFIPFKSIIFNFILFFLRSSQ